MAFSSILLNRAQNYSNDIENDKSVKFSETIQKTMNKYKDKIKSKIIDEDAYNLFENRKKVHNAYEKGEYFKKAHNFDFVSGLVFSLGNLLGEQELLVNELTPIVTNLAEKTNNPLLKSILATTSSGLLQAKMASDVKKKTKLLNKIETAVEQTAKIGEYIFQGFKYLGTELAGTLKEISSHFVTDVGDFVSNFLSNVGFLGPFIKILWPYVSQMLNFLKAGLFSTGKLLIKHLIWNPVKLLGKSLLGKILFKPKKTEKELLNTSVKISKTVSEIGAGVEFLTEKMNINNTLLKKFINVAKGFHSEDYKGVAPEGKQSGPKFKFSDKEKGSKENQTLFSKNFSNLKDKLFSNKTEESEKRESTLLKNIFEIKDKIVSKIDKIKFPNLNKLESSEKFSERIYKKRKEEKRDKLFTKIYDAISNIDKNVLKSLKRKSKEKLIDKLKGWFIKGAGFLFGAVKTVLQLFTSNIIMFVGGLIGGLLLFLRKKIPFLFKLVSSVFSGKKNSILKSSISPNIMKKNISPDTKILNETKSITDNISDKIKKSKEALKDTINNTASTVTDKVKKSKEVMKNSLKNTTSNITDKGGMSTLNKAKAVSKGTVVDKLFSTGKFIGRLASKIVAPLSLAYLIYSSGDLDQPTIKDKVIHALGTTVDYLSFGLLSKEGTISVLDSVVNFFTGDDSEKEKKKQEQKKNLAIPEGGITDPTEEIEDKIQKATSKPIIPKNKNIKKPITTKTDIDEGKVEFSSPLASKEIKIVSYYDKKKHPYIKIQSKNQSDVVGTYPGYITRIERGLDGSYAVEIVHKQGYSEIISGLSNVFLKQGDYVDRGTRIGQTDSSKSNTIKYGVLFGGKNLIDPLNLLNFSIQVPTQKEKPKHSVEKKPVSIDLDKQIQKPEIQQPENKIDLTSDDEDQKEKKSEKSSTTSTLLTAAAGVGGVIAAIMYKKMPFLKGLLKSKKVSNIIETSKNILSKNITKYTETIKDIGKTIITKNFVLNKMKDHMKNMYKIGKKIFVDNIVARKIKEHMGNLFGTWKDLFTGKISFKKIKDHASGFIEKGKKALRNMTLDHVLDPYSNILGSSILKIYNKYIHKLIPESFKKGLHEKYLKLKKIAPRIFESIEPKFKEFLPSLITFPFSYHVASNIKEKSSKDNEDENNEIINKYLSKKEKNTIKNYILAKIEGNKYNYVGEDEENQIRYGKYHFKEHNGSIKNLLERFYKLSNDPLAKKLSDEFEKESNGNYEFKGDRKQLKEYLSKISRLSMVRDLQDDLADKYYVLDEIKSKLKKFKDRDEKEDYLDDLLFEAEKFNTLYPGGIIRDRNVKDALRTIRKSFGNETSSLNETIISQRSTAYSKSQSQETGQTGATVTNDNKNIAVFNVINNTSNVSQIVSQSNTTLTTQ